MWIYGLLEEEGAILISRRSGVRVPLLTPLQNPHKIELSKQFKHPFKQTQKRQEQEDKEEVIQTKRYKPFNFENLELEYIAYQKKLNNVSRGSFVSYNNVFSKWATCKFKPLQTANFFS